MTSLRLATRGSPLALEQARRVAERFSQLASPIETDVVVIETRGDRDANRPIRELGRDGVFAVEVERAVLDGRADIAVHSAKDLPSAAPPAGLVLAATPERVDARDALIGRTLEHLPPGAIVATGSSRRRAQLAWIRPDLGFVELRGNIATRLAKIPSNGAVVIAYAALVRLGLAARADEVFPTEVLLPQVGQGALALRCRADDEATREFCAAIDEAPVHRAVDAERAFLARLEGGCDAPVGAFATTSRLAGPLRLEAFIARDDGHALVRGTIEGDDPVSIGQTLADDLLERCGGRELVELAAT
jgi:hydroxymethylbilane synthase